jgi:hypothetical protein
MKKVSSKREKWIAAGLGVVCVSLLANLAVRSNFVRAGAPHSTAPQTPARTVSASAPHKGPSPVPDELARYDPEVRLDLLSDLDSRPLPEIDRNPFQFGQTKADIQAQQAQQATNTQPPPPPPPPPLPPITVKAMGYADGAGGRKAILIDDPQTPEHQDTYEAKEGDTVANKYKVLKITPTAVTIEVQDETPRRTVDLEFPQ